MEMTWEECQKQYDKLCWKMVNKYKLFVYDPKSLYLLDQELATRIYSAPSLVL